VKRGFFLDQAQLQDECYAHVAERASLSVNGIANFNWSVRWYSFADKTERRFEPCPLRTRLACIAPTSRATRTKADRPSPIIASTQRQSTLRGV